MPFSGGNGWRNCYGTVARCKGSADCEAKQDAAHWPTQLMGRIADYRKVSKYSTRASTSSSVNCMPAMVALIKPSW